jgi:hypothetical protein
MFHGVKMLGGVFILRRVATAHVAAYQAQAQMHPAVAHLYALRADVGGGSGDFYFAPVFALFRHFIFRAPAPLW